MGLFNRFTRKQSPPAALPAPDLIRNAAASIVADPSNYLPKNWQAIDYIVWYQESDPAKGIVVRARVWATTIDGTRQSCRTMHDTVQHLVALHDQMSQHGQTWVRCDMRLQRENPDADPSFTIDFKYELGTIPD